MSISHDELQAIVAVVDAGSFRKAATKLHKAQSAISYAIKNLEQKLKIKIFEREGQKTQLTKAGSLIYTKALNIMKINSEILQFSEVISEGVETKLDLSLIVVTPMPTLIEVLKDFNIKFPQTQIELNLKSFEEPIDSVLDGSADFAISCGKLNTNQVEKVKWREIEFIPVCSPFHSAALENLSEEDLSNITYLVVGGRKTLANRKYLGNVNDANVWNVTDFLHKKEFLMNGLGWGYVPKDLVERELEEGLLVKVPAKKSYVKQLDIVRKKDSLRGPAANYLWTLFMQHRSLFNQPMWQVN